MRAIWEIYVDCMSCTAMTPSMDVQLMLRVLGKEKEKVLSLQQRLSCIRS